MFGGCCAAVSQTANSSSKSPERFIREGTRLLLWTNIGHVWRLLRSSEPNGHSSGKSPKRFIREGIRLLLWINKSEIWRGFYV